MFSSQTEVPKVATVVAPQGEGHFLKDLFERPPSGWEADLMDYHISIYVNYRILSEMFFWFTMVYMFLNFTWFYNMLIYVAFMLVKDGKGMSMQAI